MNSELRPTKDEQDELAELRRVVARTRARKAAERASELAARREAGQLCWNVEPYPDGESVTWSAVYDFRDGSGTVSVRAGVVTIYNLPEHPFDYRAVVGITPKPTRRQTGPGSFVVVQPEGSAQPVVEELTVIRRDGGPAIGGRSIRALKAGEVARMAIGILSGHVLTEGSAREILRPLPARRRDPAEDLPIVVEACGEAERSGISRMEAVRRALDSAGKPSSRGQAAKLIDMAIKAGKVAPGRPGRPRSAPVPSRIHPANIPRATRKRV